MVRNRETTITRRKQKKVLVLPRPKMPQDRVVIDLPIAVAVQALAEGTATPDQQIYALKWMITTSQEGECNYHVNDRDHAFATGFEFWGKVIKGIINARLSDLTTQSE